MKRLLLALCLTSVGLAAVASTPTWIVRMGHCDINKQGNPFYDAKYNVIVNFYKNGKPISQDPLATLSCRKKPEDVVRSDITGDNGDPFVANRQKSADTVQVKITRNSSNEIILDTGVICAQTGPREKAIIDIDAIKIYDLLPVSGADSERATDAVSYSRVSGNRKQGTGFKIEETKHTPTFLCKDH